MNESKHGSRQQPSANLKTGNGKPSFAVKWSNLDLGLQLIKLTPIQVYIGSINGSFFEIETRLPFYSRLLYHIYFFILLHS